jgi:hypothetical protein
MINKKAVFNVLFLFLFIIYTGLDAKDLKNTPIDREILKGILQTSDDLFIINLQISDFRKEMEFIRKKFKLSYDVSQFKLTPLNENNSTSQWKSGKKEENNITLDKVFLKGLIQQSEDTAYLSNHLSDLRSEFEAIKKKYKLTTELSTANGSMLEQKVGTGSVSKGNEIILIEGLINQLNEISFLSEQISDLRKELKAQESNLSKSGPNLDLGTWSKGFSWTQFGKSLLLPGWGHMNTESSWKGYMYGGLFLGSSYYASAKYEDFVDQGKLSQNPGVQFSLISANQSNFAYYYSVESNKELAKAETYGNEALGAVAFIYLMSALDAGFSKTKSDPNVGFKFRTQRETLALNEKNTVFSFDYTWSF